MKLNKCSAQPSDPTILSKVSRIRPWPSNPRYWEYNGQPVLLLGGSKEDNLFQIPDLKAHLDLLQSVGGNYVRCTMSSRDPGDVWPFEKNGDMYDLNIPSTEYWNRFESLLSWGFERDIVLQIEVWDRFDFARTHWLENPYNPKNNVNYSTEESGLKEEYSLHPGKNENTWFFSVPKDSNNTLLQNYQHEFINRLLEYSLKYPNVLYCMDNETCASPNWGAYWSDYIKQKAAGQGLEVQTTEMWDPWDLNHEMHRATFEHPEIYSFVDISQNNHNCGTEHYRQILAAAKKIEPKPRPLNSVKIYGASESRYGTETDAIERFWRNIFAGTASSRFHRPPSGLGLTLTAQQHLASMRFLIQEINVFASKASPELLIQNSVTEIVSQSEPPIEAYCFADLGKTYAIYLPHGGKILMQIPTGNFRMKRLIAGERKWLGEKPISVNGMQQLEAPVGEASVLLLVSIA